MRRCEVWGTYFEEGARIIAAMALGLGLLLFLIHAAMAVPFRYPLDYGEAPLVDQAMRLAAGQNIYRRDLSVPPYTVSNYPPLYVSLLALPLKLFGPSFFFGRLLSAVSALGAAFFLGRLLYVMTRDRWAAWVAGLTLLSVHYVVRWSPLHRVDSLALGLSTAALYVVVRHGETWRGVVATALLLVAAVYTRQSYGLAAPLAAFVWLWARRGWRAAFGLAGLVGAIGLGLLGVLSLLTEGGFVFNIITANANPFRWATVARYAREVRHVAPILLALNGLMVLVGPLRWREVKASEGTSPLALWPLWLPYLVGAALAAMTVGKVGSNVNYLLELSAALSLGAGMAVAWAREAAGGTARPYVRGVALLLVAVQAAMLAHATLRVVTIVRDRYQARIKLMGLEAIVARTEGPILADEYMGMLTLGGRPLYIQPFEVTQLANAGLWDQGPLLAEIRQGTFPLILIHHFRNWPVYRSRWTAEMLQAIWTSYTPTDFLANTVVYRPLREVEGVAIVPGMERCPGAPWQLPTRGEFGLWWESEEVYFMGDGFEGKVPVRAVADGLLTRRPEWQDAVAILHDDPLHPGQKVWTFYGDMAGRDGRTSFVAPRFPPGSEAVPVRAGEVVGYQGRWRSADGGRMWVHLRFAVVPAATGEAFPDALVGRAPPDAPPLAPEVEQAGVLDPSPYLGIEGSPVMGYAVWLPPRCSGE